MDKAESFSNSGGPLFNEARSSLYDLPNKPYAINYIYGLGGRDITVEDYYEIYNDLFIIIRDGRSGRCVPICRRKRFTLRQKADSITEESE